MDWRKRWRGHLNAVRQGSEYAFHCAIRKYGTKYWIHILLAQGVSQTAAKVLEKYWIKKLDTRPPNGYNLTDGGDGVVGLVQSEKGRRITGKMSRQRWKDPKFRAKMLPIVRANMTKSSAARCGKRLTNDQLTTVRHNMKKGHRTLSTLWKIDSVFRIKMLAALTRGRKTR
jgi:hypothetical protein